MIKLNKIQYENHLKNTFKSIKVGDILSFKVTEIYDNHIKAVNMTQPEIMGIVYFDQMNRGFDFNPKEHFESGDEFKGRVVLKEIGRVLRILPIYNLSELKREQKEQSELESWMNNEK